MEMDDLGGPKLQWAHRVMSCVLLVFLVDSSVYVSICVRAALHCSVWSQQPPTASPVLYTVDLMSFTLLFWS